MNALAKLVSTNLHPLKKSIAFGVSLSNTAPLELHAWIEQVRAAVPALPLPQLRLPSQSLKRETPESIPPSVTTKQARFSICHLNCLHHSLKVADDLYNKTWTPGFSSPFRYYLFPIQFPIQPWSDYSVIGAKLYLPAKTSIASDRVVTFSDLWFRLRPSFTSTNRPQTELKFPENLFCIDAHRIPSYDPTLLLTVPAQIAEQRQKRKNKKRGPEQSDSSKRAKRKKEKCVQSKT
ncbi:hypothetical protein FBUS_11213 [Fasciolopsis buskii]|uniref:Uncharacterized protein n=1 Tax=Fasciolopsis buskii TaxID=27845 RepID=A0A8E0RW02_9TREM|nr:hypothetical protein FBUS_11213 [Fasciolopsis buski]